MAPDKSAGLHPEDVKVRFERATALALAIRAAHADDARQLLTAALLDLSAGYPDVSGFFESIRDDARWWAGLATPAELMEFMGAALERLRDTALHRRTRKQLFMKMWRSFDSDDQARFLTYARGEV